MPATSCSGFLDFSTSSPGFLDFYIAIEALPISLRLGLLEMRGSRSTSKFREPTQHAMHVAHFAIHLLIDPTNHLTIRQAS